MLGKRICIRFDTAVYFSLPRNFSESVFTRRLSTLQWIFTQRPAPPATSPPKPSGSFLRKKKRRLQDVAPPGASKSMRREEPAQHADIRKTVLSFIAHISLRCQAGRR